MVDKRKIQTSQMEVNPFLEEHTWGWGLVRKNLLRTWILQARRSHF